MCKLLPINEYCLRGKKILSCPQRIMLCYCSIVEKRKKFMLSKIGIKKFAHCKSQVMKLLSYFVNLCFKR